MKKIIIDSLGTTLLLTAFIIVMIISISPLWLVFTYDWHPLWLLMFIPIIFIWSLMHHLNEE